MKPINDLTKEELNAEIAAWCWKPLLAPFGCDMTGAKFPGADDPPDYTRCHNAIASARERLSFAQSLKFIDRLSKDLGLSWPFTKEEVYIMLNSKPLIQSRALVGVIREGRG